MAEESIHTRSINIYTIMSYDIASFSYFMSSIKPFETVYRFIIFNCREDTT